MPTRSPHSSSPSGPTAVDRRARTAVFALFFANGAVFANLLPRYPEIKAGLGIDNAVYGLAVAAFPAGALAAGLAAAALIRRLGSGRIAAIGMVCTSLGVLAAALAPATIWFAAALFLAGACDAITDVGQNTHALRVQRRYRRSIINSFHAVWSIGAVLGGAMSAAAIALHVPLGVHLAVTAALFSAVALAALPFCLPGHDEGRVGQHSAAVAAAPGRARPSARLVLMLLALVGIAVAGTTAEDAGSSWASLYLATSLGAPAALAAAGFISLVGAQFVGRLLGDRLVDRFGQRAVARSGGVIVALGMGLALAFPGVPGTIAGFAAVGLGVATLVPAAMHEADELPGLRPGTGLTVVSWLMRLGFLLSPPLVGLVADATELRIGLLAVPLAGVVVAVLAQVLPGKPHHTNVC